jgi:hypothetical protein
MARRETPSLIHATVDLDDDTHKEIEPDAVTGLDTGVHCFRADPRDVRLRWVLLKCVMGVVGELAVNADGL